MENNPPNSSDDLNNPYKQPGNQNPYGNPSQNPYGNPNQNQYSNQYQNPSQQYNYGQGYGQQQPPVPNAVAGMVLGIIGLFFSIICIYWIAAFIGLVMSIIALVLSSKAIKTFNELPGMYSESSLGNAKAGRILGIIGIIIAAIWFIVLAVIFAVAASAASDIFRQF